MKQERKPSLSKREHSDIYSEFVNEWGNDISLMADNYGRTVEEMEDILFPKTKTPLWKELNEKRTKGEWKQPEQEQSLNEYSVVTDNMNIADFLAIDIQDEEGEANAAYAVLAVNNLAALAEALEVINNKGVEAFEKYANNKYIDWKSICGAMVEKAKEALKNIS